MSYREREEKESKGSVPNGMEHLGKELEILQWISSSILLLERVKACKRNDALKASLAELLEHPQLTLTSAIVKSASESASFNERMSQQLTLLKEENLELRNENSFCSKIMERYPDLLTNAGYRVYRFPKVITWILFSFFLGMVVSYLQHH